MMHIFILIKPFSDSSGPLVGATANVSSQDKGRHFGQCFIDLQ